MSKHIVLNTMFVALMGASVGYGISKLMHSEANSSERQLASIPLHKLGIDQVSFDYIDVKIDNVTVADAKEQTSIVQMRLTALKNIPTTLNYQWILGKDVTTSDQLTGLLQPMNEGDSQIIELRVQNYSKEWQSHVSLSLSGDLNGHKVQREVIVSSRPEDSFEYVVKQAALADQNVPAGKVQKLSDGKTVREKFRRSNVIR